MDLLSTGCKKTLYSPRDAEITTVRNLTADEKLFTLRLTDGSDLNHLPGQFVQLSIPGFTEAPISVASSPTRGGYFDLAIRRAGFLTEAMHGKVAGDTVGIRGPFGSSFELSLLRGRDLSLISGGCGLAPLRSLILYCQDRPEEFGHIEIVYGARDPDMLLFKEELEEWSNFEAFSCRVTVDSAGSGSCYEGPVGMITALIPQLSLNKPDSYAVIVGPPPMYRSVITELKKKGVTSDRIIISLERNMRCGVGKCGHCAIEHLYCCMDGPVFRLDMVEGIRGAI